MKKISTSITGLLITSFLFAQSIEIKVKDFGAIPNDKKDDTPAILSALKACKNKANPKLIFESGAYDIYGSQKNSRGNFDPSITIENIDNLTIEGNGAELIGHDYSTMFHFVNCTNVTVNNLTIDWDPLPFTQGKVVQVDSGYIDIEVLPPFVAKPGLQTQAILGYDLKNNRMSRKITDHYQLNYRKTTEVVRPGIMRLFVGYKDRFAGVMPTIGNYIIARHHVYGYQAYEFTKCANVQLENITIYSSPGMGVTGKECRNISINHLKVMIRPGSGRWMSSTADATHFRACRGSLTMTNCLFEGMGDDATNVRSSEYLLVAEQLSVNKVKLKTGNHYGGKPLPPQTGDKLELSSGNVPLLPYSTLTVRSVDTTEDGKALIVGFLENLPQNLQIGDIAGNATSCPILRIQNCVVINNRSRGFIIKTRNAIIEDCTFQDITGCGIALETDINAWWEAISASDVIIRNNRFVNVKFEPGYLHGVIEFHTMSSAIPAGVYREISIENNIFLGSTGNILKIGSADGVDIKNNIMDQPEEEAIFLYNSKNIRIYGNRLSNCKAPLKIGEGCDKATITTERNIGF